jgi:ATP-binding cassette subfamily G (WHITE) protein 2 (PDR)
VNIDLVSAIASTGLSGRQVICAENELAVMQPPTGTSCGTYLTPYAQLAGGRIYNPGAMADCQYCTASNADQFLQSVAISYGTRWRDYGIGFAYIVFNIFMAVFLYYVIRVRKGSGTRGVRRRKHRKTRRSRFLPELKVCSFGLGEGGLAFV